MTKTSFSPRVVHIQEPKLEFGLGQCLVYPRDGLYLFGPVGDTSAVPTVRYGAIGTVAGVRRLRTWAKKLDGFIPIPAPGPRSRPVEPHHIPFPGFAEAFHSEWPAGPSHVIDDLDPALISQALRIGNRHEAIKETVDIFVNRLIDENNRLENPPSFWFVIIPEEVYELGRPQSRVVRSDRVRGSVKLSRSYARKLQTQARLFPDEELQLDVYKYATHFRRQLKARLLRDKIVTQIVRETTLTPDEFLRKDGIPVRRVEDSATIAWKLATAAYYKGGGRPWQLANVRPSVCYVGLVYKRSDLTSDDRHACCAAQMFLTNGDGIVFRGALGPWYQTDTKQFHLDSASAESLARMVVGEYNRLHNEAPQELFIHAKSAFTDEEWSGFHKGVDLETNLVGVQIVDARENLKLFRPGRYPTIRGTALLISDNHAFLWTSGYVPRLDTYMGPETPNPLSIRVVRGDCNLDVVLQDIMGLTKINFNSCLHNDRLPVTIRFASDVGDVLMAAPVNGEPKLPFKFYI